MPCRGRSGEGSSSILASTGAPIRSHPMPTAIRPYSSQCADGEVVALGRGHRQPGDRPLRRGPQRSGAFRDTVAGPVNVSNADLRGADLRGSRLSCRDRAIWSTAMSSNFSRADMRGFDFGSSRVDDSVFDGADLRGASLADTRGVRRSFAQPAVARRALERPRPPAEQRQPVPRHSAIRRSPPGPRTFPRPRGVPGAMIPRMQDASGGVRIGRLARTT